MKTTRHMKRSAKRLFRLCFVNGRLDEPRTRQIVERISEATPSRGLPVLLYFQRLVQHEYAQNIADVQSAIPLTADGRAKILSALARNYGPAISASFAHNPALIGGMRIKVGSDVYDGSVRGRLAALERSF